MGSPIYMSPEQCRGFPCDARSDIYSLGCVMYRCLTGTMPIKGENPLDTMNQHISAIPLTLSQANPAAGIPARLEKLVMKMLAKNPDERPQTAGEVGAELSSILTGLAEISTIDRTVKTAASGTDVPVLPQAAVYDGRQLSQADGTIKRSGGSWSTAGGFQAQAGSGATSASPGAGGFGTTSGAPPTGNAVKTDVSGSQSKSGSPSFKKAIAALIATTALVGAGFAANHWWQEQAVHGAKDNQKQETIQPRSADVSSRPDDAGSSTQDSTEHKTKPRQPETRATAQAPVTAEGAKSKSPEHPRRTRSEALVPPEDWNRPGHLPRPPEKHPAQGDNHPHNNAKISSLESELKLDEARIAFDEHQPAKAEPLYAQSLAAMEKVKGRSDPDLLPIITKIMACWNEQRQPEKALPYFDQAMKIYSANEAKFDKDPGVLFPLGAASMEMEDWNTAIDLYRKGLAVRRQQLQSSPDKTSIVAPLNQLARAFIKVNNYPAAERTLKDALDYSDGRKECLGYVPARKLYYDLLVAQGKMKKAKEVESQLPPRMQDQIEQHPINSKRFGRNGG